MLGRSVLGRHRHAWSSDDAQNMMHHEFTTHLHSFLRIGNALKMTATSTGMKQLLMLPLQLGTYCYHLKFTYAGITCMILYDIGYMVLYCRSIAQL